MLRTEQITSEGRELTTVRDLFRAYEKELDEDICFQRFEAELKNPLEKYGPPSGELLLAYWKEQPAGCIAMTKLDEPGVCEMKRLYVKPEFRKNKIGIELIRRLLTAAKDKGYTTMRLDTLEKLSPALELYRSLGFRNISAYYFNPLPGVFYMEKEL